jgi:hypothetical protein
LFVLKGAISVAVGMQKAYALLLALPMGFVVYWVSRPRAVHLPSGLRTVGELVIWMTNFGEHKESGYQWTRNEIALKVRIILSESTGVDLDDIQPETTLAELAAC